MMSQCTISTGNPAIGRRSRWRATPHASLTLSVRTAGDGRISAVRVAPTRPIVRKRGCPAARTANVARIAGCG